MDKFWIVNRPRPDQTLEEFDYEWGVMHLSLMVTTRPSMNAFHRYAQNRSVTGVDDSQLLIGRSDKNWYGIADHWIDGLGGLNEALTPEYVRRMQPHNFADSAFVLELTAGAEVAYDQESSFSGRGVKIVQFLRRREGVAQADFLTQWHGTHADLVVVDDARSGGPVRRYVQNPQMPLDAAMFAGTLFEAGGVQTYAGIEELWFDDLDALHGWAGEPERRAALEEGLGSVVDLAGSFAMVVVERVAFDRTVPGAPLPAIFDPNSFESRLVGSERPADSWNAIEPAIPAESANSLS